MCIELWRVVTALAMFVVIDAEIVIVDLARAEVAMHEGNIGFHWIFQSCVGSCKVMLRGVQP